MNSISENEIVNGYDDPALSPLEFLLCVMHDPSVPIDDRLQAAKASLPYVYTPVPVSREYDYTLVIPALPEQRQGFATPEQLQEIIRIVGAMDIDALPLCTKCGHRMPFPCEPEHKPLPN